MKMLPMRVQQVKSNLRRQILIAGLTFERQKT